MPTQKELLERLAFLEGKLHAQAVVAAPNTLQVGIRNVSPNPVGVMDDTVNPARDVTIDPGSYAVISYTFWQKLRGHKFLKHGVIVRDDSVLGPMDLKAPADKPEELPKEASVNVIEDAKEWLLSKTEDELKEAIAAITSEYTIRKLLRAIATEIDVAGERYDKKDPDRVKKAERSVPAIMRIAEEYLDDRLDQLNPMRDSRESEMVFTKE